MQKPARTVRERERRDGLPLLRYTVIYPQVNTKYRTKVRISYNILRCQASGAKTYPQADNLSATATAVYHPRPMSTSPRGAERMVRSNYIDRKRRARQNPPALPRGGQGDLP